MREILDPVDPEHLRPLFGDVFRQLQRGKALEPFEFYAGCYLLSLDGTGYFSSQKIHCPLCQVKEHQSGAVSYEHQMLAAVIVHPDLKEVIPLAPEPIQKQDGSTKNDCERNAARRLLEKIRREHPRLKLIVVEDGLSSNGPHVRDLIDYGMHFLLGVQPGDHAFLFAQVEAARREGRSPKLTRQEKGITCEVSWVWGVALNESNQDLRVDFLVDQTQQLCCGLFRAVWEKLGSKRALWDNLRSHFRHFRFRSMRHLYEAILFDLGKEVSLPSLDTS